jgi:uncharacterized membrane protein YbhN (UPF0104 family)
MSYITGAVEEVLLASLLSEKVLTSGRTRTESALCVVSAILGIAALFFLSLAVFRHLESLYEPDVSALAAAGLALAAAAVVGLSAKAIKRERRTRVGAATAELRNNITAIIGDVAQELEGPVTENPKLAMVVALIAGYFLADHHTRH